MRICGLTLLLGISIVALAVDGAAAASGGTSIAKAPLLASAAKLSGDTTSDSTTPATTASASTRAAGTTSSSGGSSSAPAMPRRSPAAASIPATTSSSGSFRPGRSTQPSPGQTRSRTAFRSSVRRLRRRRTRDVRPRRRPELLHGVDGPFGITVTVVHGAAPVKTDVTLPAQVAASGSVVVTVKGPAGVAITDPKLVLKLYGTGPARHTCSVRLRRARARRASRSVFPGVLKGTRIGLGDRRRKRLRVVKSASVQRRVT